MDARPLFQALQALAEDNAAFFQRSGTESGRRFAAAFAGLREHGRRLEPVLRHFVRLYHRFDLDEATPGNGYRSLVQTARCCLAHAVHKSRYVAAHRRSLFFRAGHNAAELEAYCAALAQLRALLYLAQRLLARSRPGCLFLPEEDGVSELVLREYCTMRNGCFYGRCLGFQVAPGVSPAAAQGAQGMWEWAIGGGAVGMWGHGTVGTRGRGDGPLQGFGAVGTQGWAVAGLWGCGDMEAALCG